MTQLPIPDDWNEATDGYVCVFLCAPNSRLWRAIIRGKIYELTRGRKWDADTGNIKDTQAIAWEILESMCMANCQDIVDALNSIAVSLSTDGLTRAVRELTAVVGGHARDFTVPIPDNVDYTSNGLAPVFYDNQGERLANFLDQIEENLVLINGNIGFVNNELATINTTLNETLNLDTQGGLANNINDRLKNLNITTGGLIDGVDLIGIAESLAELNKIRNALETTVITPEGVERQGIATVQQENTDNITYILDRIRDNLDISIFDAGASQIKEYSITAALYTRITEFIEIVDKIRDNLDAVVDVDTEMGLAGMIDALNLSAARINHNLRCVADSLNGVCVDTSTVTPPYLNVETSSEETDFEAALQAIREDLISDTTEGRSPWQDETDDDYHIADGTFTLVTVIHTAGQDPDTGYLLIDVTTDGKCELVFNIAGSTRSMIAVFLKPQEQVYMMTVPDTGTLKVLNEATGDTTSINY